MLTPSAFDEPADQADILRMFLAMRWVVEAGKKMTEDQRTRAFHGFGVDPATYKMQPDDVDEQDL